MHLYIYIQLFTATIAVGLALNDTNGLCSNTYVHNLLHENPLIYSYLHFLTVNLSIHTYALWFLLCLTVVGILYCNLFLILVPTTPQFPCYRQDFCFQRLATKWRSTQWIHYLLSSGPQLGGRWLLILLFWQIMNRIIG